ncbi:unnamed protein product, partial [Rotaria sp. Silwood1]
SLQTLIIKGDAIKFTSKLRVYSLNNKSMDSSTEYGISESNKYRQHLIKGQYSPTSSTRKINLLLQRSLRYSYRQVTRRERRAPSTERISSFKTYGGSLCNPGLAEKNNATINICM